MLLSPALLPEREAKRAPHREVSPANGDVANDDMADLQLLQRRIDPPMLIDGRSFDVGVYVGFQEQQNGTLTVTLFDDLLLRFCEERCPFQSKL